MDISLASQSIGLVEKAPDFSIIIGVHPRYGRLIEECIDSVLRQTQPSFELILVSGPSVWDLGTICDSRIRQIKVDDDANYCLKKNAGIEASLGKYLVFVDCDDLMSPFYLEKAYKLFQENQCDCVVFGATRNYQDFAVCDTSDPFFAKGKDDVYRLCFSRYCKENDPRARDLILDSVWGKAFSAELVKKHMVRFPIRPVRADDVLFGNAFFVHASKIAFDSSFLSYYWRPNSSSEMANLSSPFYDIDGFIAGLRTILSPVQNKFVDNLDQYLSTVARSQFDLMVRSYINRIIRLKDAKSFFDYRMPRSGESFQLLVQSHPPYAFLIRWRWIRLYCLKVRMKTLLIRAFRRLSAR